MPPFDNNNSFSVSSPAVDLTSYQTIAGSNAAIAAASQQVSNLIAPLQDQTQVQSLIDANKPNTRFVLPGLFNRLFSQGSSGVGYDFMEWVSNVGPATQMPTMIFPFTCRLTQITCKYLGAPTLPFLCQGTDNWTVKVYSVPTGSSPVFGVASQLGPDLFKWDAALNNTFPSTNYTLPTPITINAGTEIAIVGVETVTTAQLADDESEAQVCLVFEYD